MTQLKKQYNTEELFKSDKTKKLKEQNLPKIIKKESIIRKFINRLKKIFGV